MITAGNPFISLYTVTKLAASMVKFDLLSDVHSCADKTLKYIMFYTRGFFCIKYDNNHRIRMEFGVMKDVICIQ